VEEEGGSAWGRGEVGKRERWVEDRLSGRGWKRKRSVA
jgi:hypothetical protein